MRRALFYFRARTLAEEAVIFTHGRQVGHLLIEAEHNPSIEKRELKTLPKHTRSNAEGNTVGLADRGIALQSETYQFSTANAHAIYAFYRMAPQGARDYDSRR